MATPFGHGFLQDQVSMSMNLQTVPFTPEGFRTLTAELERLKGVDRPHVIGAIAEARAHGDLKENAEYHAAREKQGMIEARISDLEDKLARAQVIEPTAGALDTIRFGAWVVLLEEETGEKKKYRIVGDLEADISRNLLSVSSPMARALLGKKVEDLVEIQAPKGVKEFSVLSVAY
jgi:transcription elongation factor GreA